MSAAIRRMICKLRGHEWDQREAKRTCTRCCREEWLFQRRFPSVGEPALSWQEMADARATTQAEAFAPSER